MAGLGPGVSPAGGAELEAASALDIHIKEQSGARHSAAVRRQIAALMKDGSVLRIARFGYWMVKLSLSISLSALAEGPIMTLT